jgi:hypothetical protein
VSSLNKSPRGSSEIQSEGKPGRFPPTASKRQVRGCRWASSDPVQRYINSHFALTRCRLLRGVFKASRRPAKQNKAVGDKSVRVVYLHHSRALILHQSREVLGRLPLAGAGLNEFLYYFRCRNPIIFNLPFSPSFGPSTLCKHRCQSLGGLQGSIDHAAIAPSASGRSRP